MMDNSFSVVVEGGRPWGFTLQGGLEFRAPIRVGKVRLKEKVSERESEREEERGRGMLPITTGTKEVHDSKGLRYTDVVLEASQYVLFVIIPHCILGGLISRFYLLTRQIVLLARNTAVRYVILLMN